MKHKIKKDFTNFTNFTKVIPILIIFIILVFLLKLWFDGNQNGSEYKLQKDGAELYKNVFNENEINEMKNIDYKKVKEKIIKKLEKHLPKGYVFQDYIFVIKKSTIHTCHRDNNGDFFNKGQKHPSYTIITYLEDMDKCLGIIPKSHLNKNNDAFNFTDKIRNILCKKGDVIIFNSNLIHVGTINDKPDNLRIQMKISHKDDLDVLSYYQKYNKILNEDNNIPTPIIKAQRNLTCMFPYISNVTQKENVNSAKRSNGSKSNEKISNQQKVFSKLFYGNKDFYDLPNAFN